MASKFTNHNGLESDTVNSPINVTTGLEVGGLSFPSLSGTAWYVDASATGAADGRTKADAFTTITAALSAADAHDVIFVYPGTYTAALTVSDDYITIVGVQTGYGRPDVAVAGTALTVTGQGFQCARMRFVTSSDADVVVQRANGFKYVDCVFDGDSAQAATKANVRLVGSDTDDGLTASEGELIDCLVRGSDGYGVAFDVPANSGGGHVGPTHDVLRRVRFISNVAEDIIALNTGAGGAYVLQDCLFDACYIGMGTSKNKATHVDISTNQGASNTGNVFAGCYINDDTVDGTAIKHASTGSSFIGCYGLAGVIDSSSLD